MDQRGLAGLTVAALVLLQFQAYLLPGLRAGADPLRVAARHEARRAAELRRMGTELALLEPARPARRGPSVRADGVAR